MLTKVCRVCCIEKPLQEFYSHILSSDGYTGSCRVCVRARVARNRIKNIDTIREYDRERNGLPHRKEAAKLRLKTLRRNHPEKDRARNMVAKALASGKLVRKPCAVCELKRTEAHHFDYSKPLEVIWLCAVHHSAIHYGKLKLECVRTTSSASKAMAD